MPNTLIPEVVKSASQKKAVKPRRAQTRFKIRALPPAVHRELDARLNSGNYRSLDQLSDWLEQEHGQFISPSSLAYYFRHELDPMLQAVKIATAQAAEIVRATDGDDDEMSFALFRLTQTAIFDLLVQLNRARHLVALGSSARDRSAKILKTRKQKLAEDGPAPNEQALAAEDPLSSKFPSRIELVAATSLGKIVATVNKALIDWKKWREEAREKIERKVAATSARVCEVASEAGLSPEAEKCIRDALMEIKL